MNKHVIADYCYFLQNSILRGRDYVVTESGLATASSRQTTMTLSFRQASRAKENGAISWDEYIHNLLARCGGIKHDEDNDPFDYLNLLKIDPLGHSIWTWSKRIKTVTGSYSACSSLH